MAAKNPQFRYMYIITTVYNEALIVTQKTIILNWSKDGACFVIKLFYIRYTVREVFPAPNVTYLIC